MPESKNRPKLAMQVNGMHQMQLAIDHVGLCVLIIYNAWTLIDTASGCPKFSVSHCAFFHCAHSCILITCLVNINLV